MSRLALKPTQPPVQWELGTLCWDWRGLAIKLAIHLHLVLSLKISRDIPSLPLHAFVHIQPTSPFFSFLTKVFKNMVLRKIFESKKVGGNRTVQKTVMRSCMICTAHQTLRGNQIEEYVIDRACGTYTTYTVLVRILVQNNIWKT
jgi:hypothetical protein